jgi:hypothetical protein
MKVSMYSFLLTLGVWMPIGAAAIFRLLRFFPSVRLGSPGFVVIIYLTQGVGLVANLAAIAFLTFATTNLLDPIVNVVLHVIMGGLCILAIIITTIARRDHW